MPRSTTPYQLWSWDDTNRLWLAVCEGTEPEMNEARDRGYAAARQHARHSAAFYVARTTPTRSPRSLGLAVVEAHTERPVWQRGAAPLEPDTSPASAAELAPRDHYQKAQEWLADAEHRWDARYSEGYAEVNTCLRFAQVHAILATASPHAAQTLPGLVEDVPKDNGP